MLLRTGSGKRRARVDPSAYRVHLFFRFFVNEWVRDPSRRSLTTEVTGLHEASYVILRRLDERGPLSVSGLARDLALDPSTISRQLRPLRDRELIEPPRGTIGRTTVLQITDAGHELLARMELALVRDWEHVTERLPPERAHLLAELLEELQAAMQEATVVRTAQLEASPGA